MSASAFVRGDASPPRPPPRQEKGLLAFVRGRLLNTPGNIILTLLALALLWLTIVPAVRFLLIDAVWFGTSRADCLAENAGRTVGACWPFVSAKISQFIYGFYPEGERWRVNLTFLLGALLLLPLLIPRAPAKGVHAGLFFFAFPIVAFFLLHGGGLRGFAITWIADALQTLASSFADVAKGSPPGGVLAVITGALNAVGIAIEIVAEPVVAFRDGIQSSSNAVWLDFAITALIVSAAVFFFSGGFRGGGRALIRSVAFFAAAALVIVALRLDRHGLPVVDTRLWGGLLVTLVVSITGIVASMPVGIALALGRRSSTPLIRAFSVGFIEFWRGVPLITVLFFATYMLPLFLPAGFTVDGLVRVLIGIALFAGAYNAEVIRGGLQAIPRGQTEASNALGLSRAKTTGLIVLPQAIRHVIPGLVNSFIALFKDTSLVSIVALFDLLGQLRAAFADPAWSTPSTLFTGFAFTGLIYFVFCFAMSRYSLFVERRLNVHRRS